jgi:hypothetical protein
MHNHARVEREGDAIIVTAALASSSAVTPTPFQFAVLRLLAITVLRIVRVNELFKRVLVRRVITGACRSGPINRRTIVLRPEPVIRDEWAGAECGWTRLVTARPFNTSQMARLRPCCALGQLMLCGFMRTSLRVP